MIQTLSINPFTVHYWTNHQIHVYNQHWKKGHVSLALDATGGLCKRIIRPNNEPSNVIYLYEGVILTEDGQFSVGQMITEAHNTNSIKHFLAEFLRSGAIAPKETVCDMSIALLTALVQELTGYFTVNEYADACRNDFLPLCYIRIDVAHFKHLYVIFLKDKRLIISKLFKNMLDLIILSRSVQEVTIAIRRFLIVCRSESEGYNASGE